MLYWSEIQRGIEDIRNENWKTVRDTQYKDRELPQARELTNERELPPKRLEQMEFQEVVEPIDDREAFIRHKQAMAKLWFEYYKKCHNQQKKMALIDQYNYLARQRD